MTFRPAQLRRPMNIGEILGGSLELYHSRFRTFLIIALVALPFSVAYRFSFMGDYRNVPLTDFLFLIYLVVEVVVIAAIARAVANADDGLPPSFGSSYGHILPHVGRLLAAAGRVFGIAIIVFFPVFMASLMLWSKLFVSGDDISTREAILLILGSAVPGAIPAAFLLVRWAFFVQAVVIEDVSSGEAQSTSRQVVRGHWWRAFGVLLLLWLLAGIVGWAVMGITWAAPQLAGVLAGAAADILVLPFTGIAYTLLFFDLQSRERERVSIA